MFSSLLVALSLGLLGSSAQAIQPDADIFIGIEPIRHRTYHTEVQHKLRNREQWQRFMAQTGWDIRFDEQTGGLARAMGSGFPIDAQDEESVLSSVRSIFAEHELFHSKDMSFQEARAVFNEENDAWYVHFDQSISVSLVNDVHHSVVDRVHVWRGGVDAFVKNGRLSLIQAAVYPEIVPPRTSIPSSQALAVAIQQGAAPDSNHEDISFEGVVLPIEEYGQLSTRICWKVQSKTIHPKGHWVAFVDAETGKLHNVYNEVRFLEGNIHAVHDKRTLDGVMETSPLAYLKVGSGSFTDEEGYFSILDESFSITMNAKNTRVSNEAGDDLTFDLLDGDQTIAVEGDEALSQIDQIFFQQEIYEWAKIYAPHVVNAWPRSVVNVNMDDVCNAYFDGTLNFFRAGEGCNNTGRIRDVSHHEWGHGFHYHNLLSGDYDGSMSEGISDAVAFFLSGDPVIAPYFSQNGYGIREVDRNRVYPDDVVNQVHTDGLIFAGAIWDLWTGFQEEYGDSVAAYDALVPLFVQSLRSGPNIPSSFDAFLFTDDDNGDLSDGTPHECLLVDAFGEHGLGPKGEGGFFRLSHTPLENQTAQTAEYEIDADVQVFSKACVDSEPNQGRIVYSLDEGETWEEEDLDLSQTSLSGIFSAQAEGSVVQYYLEMFDDNGKGAQIPERGTINPFTFYVGELELIHCDDFEEDDGGFTHALISGRDQEGADDWMWGVPAGSGGDPNYAASGDKVWGNDLGGEHNGEQYNGEYQNDKHNRLTSPEYDVSGYEDVLLVYKRWLHVEDGYYDKAQILANDEVVWSNHSSRESIGDEHHQDMQWQQHVVRIQSNGAEKMNFSWEIISDAGLSMGGWNLDDVCVYGIPKVEEEAVASGCSCASSSSSSGAWLVLFVSGLACMRRRGERVVR